MTKSEQAGLKVAEWAQRHPLIARSMAWAVIIAVLIAFVYMIFDITNNGISAAGVVAATLAIWKTWRMAKATKNSSN
jgi:hypothetical protein